MKASRRPPGHASDTELRRLLKKHVKGLAIDPKKVRDHVIRPKNLEGVFSDRGPAESKLQFAPRHPIVGILPEHLDVSAFADALHNALKDNAAGYTVQLRQHGQSIFARDWQQAKRQQDGSENWTSEVQLHVASVSKLITAILMTVAMTEYNISPDAQIIDYLPDYWAKGPNIQYIVFRNLMNHTSGLTARDNFDFLDMKASIAAGISLDQNAPDHLGHYHYQNVNYGLCRVLFAVMSGMVSRTAVSFLEDWFWDLVTIEAYAQCAQTRVFQPAGVSGATLDHPAPTGLAYEGSGDSHTGWNSGSLQSVSGAAGWHLSVNEVLNVMGAFRRGVGFLTPEATQSMLDNGFGVDPFVTPQPSMRIPPGLLTPAGELYCKNGRWFDNATPRHEEQSLAYFLPQDMELVVLANSPVAAADGSEAFFRDVVTQTYLNSLTARLPAHL